MASKRFSFWADDPKALEKLIEQTLRGEKTATARPAFSWGKPKHDFDDARFAVGDICDLYDAHRHRRGRITITDVYKCRLGAIPDKLWRDEACVDARQFVDGHKWGWGHLPIDDDFKMYGIHYRLERD
ncbi:MAG: hypothetical protein FJX65_03935 [Alphaproteobacteria bacterium]|nr:hypothetical protein [Alphaproteobacteria bacterium]